MRYLNFFLWTTGALAAGTVAQTQPCASGSDWSAWFRASVFPVLVGLLYMLLLAGLGKRLLESEALSKLFEAMMKATADSSDKLGRPGAVIAAGMVLVFCTTTLIVFAFKMGEVLEKLLPRHTLPLVLLAIDFLAGGAGGISYGWVSTFLGFAPYAIGALAVLLAVYRTTWVAPGVLRQIVSGLDLVSTLPRNMVLRVRSAVENRVFLPNRHAVDLLPARLARLCGMEA